MKTFVTIMSPRIITSSAIILAFLALLSCERMPDRRSSLVLSLHVDGAAAVKSTIASVPSLKEDDISGGVNVYISGHGVFVKYSVPSPVSGGVYFLSSRWKEEGIEAGKQYDVYAVANPVYDNGTVSCLEDLEGLLCPEDRDIYKLYDPDAQTWDLSRTSRKSFLMDAHCKWTPSDAPEQTIDLTLRRAAAKVEVSFSLSPSMGGYSICAVPTWKFVNYSAAAPVLSDGNGTPGRVTTPYLMDVSRVEPDGGGIITYTYPCSWTDDVNSTVIILNVPLEDGEGNVIAGNYYSIPVVDPGEDGPRAIGRNTSYRVEVVLDCVGSSGENTADSPVRLQYNVIPWVYNGVYGNVNVEGREVEYLMVDPVETEIREKVLSQDHSVRTKDINFWASGEINCAVTEVYYYDKDDVRVDVPDGTDVSVIGTKEGKVRISSTALGNNTVKYIRLTVSLADNPSVSRNVLLRHYPLDYIQNIEGLWSSKTLSGWVDWDLDREAHTPQKTVNAGIFAAKVWDNGSIRYIQDTRRSWMYYATAGNVISNLSNRRMYVVRITSTSDSYTVGRVTLDANYQSGEHLVSPAFMIASQLGATTTTNSGTTASTHCGTYREVSTSGRSYTGWRLPTREEIGIIMGYQYTSDAIAEVLAGSHYWTLEGKAVSKTSWADTSSDASTGYVRCIRDLEVGDVEELTNRE